MRFSIIIPVYNAEKYLEKCLNSVLEQEYDDYEMLLINDGSRDSSGEICKRYAQKHDNIHYEYQDNAGPSKARNRGIDLAAGEYLVFLDSDDEIENGSLAHLDAIVSQHNVDAVISGEKNRFGADSEAVEEPLNLDAQQIHAGKSEALTELCRKRFSLLTHKIVVKRKIVIENSLRFHTEYRVGEDILMMAQVVCKCNSFYLNEKPYYIYNYNETSIMRTVHFERLWQTTNICSDLYQLSQSMTGAEKEVLNTASSMLLIGFTKYYQAFTPEQKAKVRGWMGQNKAIVNSAVATLPATSLARKFIGAKNAFLLAGLVVARSK